jgi:transcriptional regulator with XRE-family HTH domain
LAKLDDDKVREIRMLIAQGLRQREIAKRFSVSQMQISYIKNGKTWSHVL